MRVAFVVQRCGAEVNGGAETLCLQVAQRMARHWQTEVLTTCALDYMTWENFYPPGCEEIGGTLVRRFPVDAPRDVAQFNRLSEELRPRQASATLAKQEAWMRAQGPISSALLDFLAEHRDDYDVFIFFGYLYATTYVLTGQCRRAHGGLWYRNWEEFETIIRQIDAPTKDALGRQGHKYVTDFYSWDRVERDYLTLLPATV